MKHISMPVELGSPKLAASGGAQGCALRVPGRNRVEGTTSVFRPHRFLAREGEEQADLFLIQEGWACRYCLLPDGRRQITGLFLPGDWCEVSWIQGERPAQSIVALTNVRVLAVPCAQIYHESSSNADIRHDLWSEMVTIFNRQSEWMVNLGRKSAVERLCHLLYELYIRVKEGGLTYGDQFAMPLTQTDLADVTGLTPVHVNRTLRDMRSRGLVELQSKWLRIGDLEQLRQIAIFRPTSHSAGSPALSEMVVRGPAPNQPARPSIAR